MAVRSIVRPALLCYANVAVKPRETLMIVLRWLIAFEVAMVAAMSVALLVLAGQFAFESHHFKMETAAYELDSNMTETAISLLDGVRGKIYSSLDDPRTIRRVVAEAHKPQESWMLGFGTYKEEDGPPKFHYSMVERRGIVYIDLTTPDAKEAHHFAYPLFIGQRGEIQRDIPVVMHCVEGVGSGRCPKVRDRVVDRIEL